MFAAAACSQLMRSKLPSHIHQHRRVIANMLSSSSGGNSSSENMPYDDEKMIFYALGINVAKQTGLDMILKKDEVDIFLSGFSDTLTENGSVDPKEVLGKYGMALNSELQKRANKMKNEKKEENQRYIAEFLKNNASAIKTDSGLVYLCQKEGEGKQPTVEDTVEIHYHGSLIDGRVFDSSVIRKKTTLFPLQGVIKGFQEGIPMMKEGGKATLVIPSDLAYGDEGNDTIPPASTLKFEVELFKVQPTSFK